LPTQVVFAARGRTEAHWKGGVAFVTSITTSRQRFDRSKRIREADFYRTKKPFPKGGIRDSALGARYYQRRPQP